MAFKSIISAVSVTLLAISFNVTAYSSTILDQGIYTTDQISGLDWLDLTETNNLSYNYISSQLGAGGIYEGWSYATSLQVADLWSNFGIDLSAGAPTYVSGFLDPNIIEASTLLGNILNEYSSTDFSYGTLGLTADLKLGANPEMMGAYLWNPDVSSIYFPIDYTFTTPYDADLFFGSYLIRSSVVPIPPAVWLFGSGLIGLIGLARRKSHA